MGSGDMLARGLGWSQRIMQKFSGRVVATGRVLFATFLYAYTELVGESIAGLREGFVAKRWESHALAACSGVNVLVGTRESESRKAMKAVYRERDEDCTL